MSDSIHDLHSFMAQASAEMAAEYDRIYARAAEDPGTAGDQGEANWATFLKAWLPTGYHVETKGRLVGTDGRMSKQVDVVVLKPSYPRQLLEKKVWLAGGVAAVFECKTTLTAAHVHAAVQRCLEFKSLTPERKGTPRQELTLSPLFGLLAHSHSWKGAMSEPLENIRKAFEGANAAIPHPRFGLDLVCVADLATWTARYIAAYQASWASGETRAMFERAFGAAAGPVTSLLCSAIAGDGQAATFRPIGALIAALTERIAWDDHGLRDIAEYYMKANLLGSGAGSMRAWPLKIYSEEVQPRILAGMLTNGVRWDEWAISGT